MKNKTTFTLASASPFRRKMLEDAGLSFSFAGAHLDERALETQILQEGKGPRDVVLALAKAKALAVLKAHPEQAALGADQALALGSSIIGKPKDEAQAFERLRMLSGHTHQLMTGVCLALPDGRTASFVEVTKLTFRTLTSREITEYVETGEWEGCAGGYRIEGQGIRLVQSIDGDFFNIVGLPLIPVLELLRRENLLP